MQNKSKRLGGFLVYGVFSTFLIVLVGALLRSGYEYIGDGQIFVFRDGLFGFLALLATCNVLGLVWCAVSLKLPRYDYIGRIIGVNLVIYGALGLGLVWMRIPLYSRTLILSEFLVSTLLILLFFHLRGRFFPILIGTFSPAPKHVIGAGRFIRWIPLDVGTALSANVDAVILEPERRENLDETRLITTLSQRGKTVYDRNHIEMLITGRIRIDTVTPAEFDNISAQTSYALIKRAIDLFIAFLLVPVLVLSTIVLAVLIKLDSPGPVFFSQKRVGFKGRIFTLYKFRSMFDNETSRSAKFAEENDRRVTRVGRVLRKTRLDEVPQFWNVLKGDMSIIGPRPEQTKFVDRFTRVIPYYGFRHTVYPGITGWAQTMHGYAADEIQTRRKLEYDFFYIKNISPWLDLVICIRTFKVLVLGQGAR
jgi:UDP-GalNAc:undecaprenyl-phosphate GalNAc-1-phosphate transferase